MVDYTKYLEKPIVDDKKYLDIWTLNPKYIERKIKKFPLIFYSCLTVFIIVSSLILGISVVRTIFFLIFSALPLFQDFILKYSKFRKNSVKGQVKLDPFEDLEFYTYGKNRETLIINNLKELRMSATRLFKIEILPENIQPNINKFIKGISKEIIQFSYQVVQSPIKKSKYQSSDYSLENFATSLIFAIFREKKGILTSKTVKEFDKYISKISKQLQSEFSSNFPHTKISLLKGKALVNAIRSFTLGIEKEDTFEENYLRKFKLSIYEILFTYFFFILINIIISFFLNQYNIEWHVILMINIIIGLLILIKIKPKFLHILLGYLFSKQIPDFSLVHPFRNVTFFKYKEFKSTIFLKCRNELLIGTKVLNLSYGQQPSFYNPDKFFRAMNLHHLPYCYTLQANSVHGHTLLKKKSALNEFGQTELEKIFGRMVLDGPSKPGMRNPFIKFSNWMNQRSGLWDSILTLSTSAGIPIHDISRQDMEDLEEILDSNINTIRGSFESNFEGLELSLAMSKSLKNALIFQSTKNNIFCSQWSDISHLIFQGKRLVNLIHISNEFKKGIDTQVAAEFNTPLNLNNWIVLGETLNTEFMEPEATFGFTQDQVNALLITNGKQEERVYAAMKIVKQLTIQGRPSIVFDFDGTWSKLIRHLELSKKFLIFKLGVSLKIDLINSGIPNDSSNIDYLNLFYDVFSLTFKETKYNVDLLRESIERNSGIDVNSLALDFTMTKDIKHQSQYNRLLSLLKDFQNVTGILTSRDSELPREIDSLEFIRNDKTVIIDLSILGKLSQKVFISFVILAKYIHLIRHENKFVSKTIIIPNVELFFDSDYIEDSNNSVDYGVIEQFLLPLLNNGFGFIFLTNHVKLLHSNFFNHVKNIITFRAVDIKDILALKNIMNLQDLHGTVNSSKRNNAYQIEFLKNLSQKQVIVKREDIPHPFPALINSSEFTKIPQLNREEIHEFMLKQGYEIRDLEGRLTSSVQKTLFRKDLGIYSEFTDEIIKFLEAIKQVEGIGNLYKDKVKKELKLFIDPKVSLRTKDRRSQRELRDTLFQILLRQGYLVESHPPMASGSQSIRTSYRVGSKFDWALEDYYQSKIDVPITVESEVLDEENPEPIFDPRFLNSDFFFKMKDSLIELYNKGFHMYRHMQKETYQEVFKIGSSLISSYFRDLLKCFYRDENYESDDPTELNAFAGFLRENGILPFHPEELNRYNQFFEKDFPISGDKQLAEDVYDYTMRFAFDIKNHLESINNNNFIGEIENGT
ncbi:MAG: hypothetical protein ACTSX4_09170 [Candidatus Helarchaeota archaeon]